jgi:hypothetical protein
MNKSNVSIDDSTSNYYIEIIDSTSALSGIITLPFEYSIGNHNLFVYLNGVLISPIENIDGSNYGDYEETNSNTITINTDILDEDDVIRIYDYIN